MIGVCAFEGCQAGGVILAGAPRKSFGHAGPGPLPTYVEYHPGCWDAEQRRAAK